MTADEYLSNVLASQALGDDSDEVKALQKHRADVEKLLRDNFKDTGLTIRYAGSKAKGTMNKESYDLDIISYVTPATTVRVRRSKTSTITIRRCWPINTRSNRRDLHCGSKGAMPKTRALIFISMWCRAASRMKPRPTPTSTNPAAEKKRLKTNLDVHLDHVRDSGLIDAIRVAKLWRVRNGLPIRTFVLELAVIKLLAGKKKKSLSGQMEHFWTELRDNSANLTVEDPANPNGNDLSKCLDDNLKSQLASTAKCTLDQIDSSSWEAVYRQDRETGKGGAGRDFAPCGGCRDAFTALASKSMTWHRDDPTLYEKEKAEVEAYFPELRFAVENDLVYVRGSFAVIFEGQVLDRYLVELQLARNHPTGLPTVRETGGRIPHYLDRHINTVDGTACVLIPDERWRLWPVGASLLKFLTGPLHSFFLAQTMIEEGEPWPYGQWAHGAKGVFQYYRELLMTSDLRVMTTYLDYLASKKVKGHWDCPCKSGKKLRHCHFGQIKDLRDKISRKDAEKSLTMLKAAGTSAIEMTEAKPAASITGS